MVGALAACPTTAKILVGVLLLFVVARPAGVGAVHVGRAPLERGCLTVGGSGQYTVDMTFDDREIGGSTTTLKIVLDTGSANLQVVSKMYCPTCLNFTSVQYPGPVTGPGFSINHGHTFGTHLGHATSAILFGALQLNAIEFSPIVRVTSRFFQVGAAAGLLDCFRLKERSSITSRCR